MNPITFQFAFEKKSNRDLVCEVFKRSYGYPTYAPLSQIRTNSKEFPSILKISPSKEMEHDQYILEITCYTEQQVISVLETFHPTEPVFGSPINYMPATTIPEPV